jgi:hypothetical protein
MKNKFIVLLKSPSVLITAPLEEEIKLPPSQLRSLEGPQGRPASGRSEQSNGLDNPLAIELGW